MKTNSYLVILFAAATLCACNKMEQGSGTGIPAQQQKEAANFCLTASSGTVSKTALDEHDYITWESGDAISVWEVGNAGNSNVKLTLKESSAGARKGVFTGTLTPAGQDFRLYAIYPYSSAYAADPAAVALNVPSSVEQCPTVNDVVGVSDFLVGSASLSSSDEEYAMLFRHPLTLLDIQIDGSNSVLSGATIGSLTITANTAFVGDATMNLTTGELTPVAEGGKTLTITFPSTAKMSELQHAWVATLPADLTNADCCFDLTMTNGQEIKFNVNPKKAFEAQNIYTVKISDIDAKVDEGKASPVYFDLLSTTGGKRGNCYIVREGGYYKFAAQRVDKSNCFEGDKPATNGYKADWLWATGTESKVSGVGLGNSGNINFRVAANANGNTIVALYKPDEKIAWSWHIWCTVEDPTTPTHYGRNNSWLMIDRNLGALSNKEGDVDSYGLMYQWGRKDPFPGPKTVGKNAAEKESAAFGDNTQAYVFNPTAAVSTFSSVRNSVAGATDEIAYSIENPTTNIHYYSNAGSNGKKFTWFYSKPVADAKLMWNSTGNANGKTNYDPCPAGYYVPVTNAYAWYTTWNANVSWESDTNLSGVVFKENDSNKSYYPAVGYRASGQLINVGYSCYYWAANAIEDGENLSAYGLGNYGRTKFVNGSKNQTAWALPVRCMKMQN